MIYVVNRGGIVAGNIFSQVIRRVVVPVQAVQMLLKMS
jgi:hypothetical protein